MDSALRQMIHEVRTHQPIEQHQTVALMLTNGAIVIFRENVGHIQFIEVVDKLEGKRSDRLVKP